jgi:hypothetical protein
MKAHFSTHSTKIGESKFCDVPGLFSSETKPHLTLVSPPEILAASIFVVLRFGELN